MSGNILLDTCAAIWVTENAMLRNEAISALDRSADLRIPVMISPVSAWELGMLVSRKRYPLPITVQAWFDDLIVPPYSESVELTIAIMIDSSFLPGSPPKDPFDRILVAIARAKGYRIMTRDRKIIDYADQGHVQVIPC
jgi:PIN domain nuclease of toxin-antitoxin system